MRTVKTKTTYRTEDGREFTDEKIANRHEELVTAKRAYEKARQALGSLLAERFKTADGYRFEIGLHDYYWITPGYFSMPNLLKVDFWYRNWDWKEGSEEDTTLVLISTKDDYGKPMDHGREIPINQLYFDHDKAEEALLVCQRAWLEEKLREVQKKENA